MSDVEDSDTMNSIDGGERHSLSHRKAKEHAQQLQRLQEKDPEFYQYLKEHDEKLLEFDVEDIDDAETEGEDVVEAKPDDKLHKQPGKVITTAMVDTWLKEIKEHGKLGAVRSLLRAFRTACHYGDDMENDSGPKFSIISSSVFNRIMVYVLNEMDGILRGVLKAPSSGGKRETIMELTTTKVWKKNSSLMKLYLGNALHILTQMTDEQMISFTLKRVKTSAVFLAAFPTLLRKYIKVVLHTWGTGRGALPVVSILFLRDLCVRLGSDCLDTCLKGVYKAYVMNCKLAKSVSRSKLQHIQFLGNCVTELYGVDPPSAYQHAFAFIRQLAVVLRGALTERGSKVVKDKKEEKKQQESSKSSKQHLDKAYQKVYDWQFVCCLELWTGVICAYSSEADFRPLAYPLSQIICGVASLVPTARFLPLRLRCVRMLNRLAGATGMYIPVSPYLLDMLELKELNARPTGGIGKAVNLLGVKQVDKMTVKTRAFQEACIYSIVEELAEHLAQWSYSVAFFELSFVPLVRLRGFCKCTDVDRLRREIKELVRQVEANCQFTNSKRMAVDFSPNDPAMESFLQAEKESGSSPLSRFVAKLRVTAQQRNDSLVESSVVYGTESSVFRSKISDMNDDDEEDEDEGANVFSSSWLPEKKPKSTVEKAKASKKRSHQEYEVEGDEDLVEDLVLSSDEDDDQDDDDAIEQNGDLDEGGERRSKPLNNKQKVDKSSKQNIKKDPPSRRNRSKRRRPRSKKAKKGA